MDIKNLSDDDILELYKKKATSLSFYNAAEGQSWYQERSAREQCRSEFKEVVSEIKKRGLETPTGDYLI